MSETPEGVPGPLAPFRPAGDWPEAEPAPFAGHGVWWIDLGVDPAELVHCSALLDAGERARAERFLRRQDRDRFIASHAALRIVLGAALDCDPAAVAYTVSSTGRPSLTGFDAGRLDFNLSHSGRHALVALSTAAWIGVDVEVRRPIPDALRIARAHFHPSESAALEAAGPDRENAFYAVWTAKEAYVKAVGAGLSMPLRDFAVAIPPAPPALLQTALGPAAAWTLIGLALTPDAAGAVAIAAPRAACRLARLRADWTTRLRP